MTEFDTIIVGGGVHGASVFYHLTRLGANRILLLEGKRLGSAATGRSTGIIRFHYSQELTVRLAVHGSAVFRDFHRRFGQDISYVNNGFLLLAPESEAKALQRAVDLHRRIGVAEVAVLPEEIQKYHPDLKADGVALAAFEKDAGHADPYSVTVGYAKAGEAAGGRVMVGTRVTDVSPQPSGGFRVNTENGEFRAKKVVLAVGAWARSVGERLGVDIPVTPLRISNAILELPGGYDGKLPTVIDLPNHLYFRPEGHDLLIGNGEGLGDIDPDRFDESLPYSFVEEVSERLIARMPRSNDARYKNGWRGLDGASPDFHPIVGPVPETEGLYVCVGMSGHGFKLAPAIGLALAELIANGRYVTFDLTPYSLERFAKGESLESLYSMRILA